MRGGDVIPALNRQYERPQSAAPRGKIHNNMYDLNLLNCRLLDRHLTKESLGTWKYDRVQEYFVFKFFSKYIRILGCIS